MDGRAVNVYTDDQPKLLNIVNDRDQERGSSLEETNQPYTGYLVKCFRDILLVEDRNYTTDLILLDSS